mmetsp:Transcript_44729/g.106154  ORF Transcript_44729/g.106154 Transcript_44729/m.106154 type:complete len:241 (+) Transcript_44729:674-1396(+)
MSCCSRCSSCSLCSLPSSSTCPAWDFPESGPLPPPPAAFLAVLADSPKQASSNSTFLTTGTVTCSKMLCTASRPICCEEVASRSSPWCAFNAAQRFEASRISSANRFCDRVDCRDASRSLLSSSVSTALLASRLAVSASLSCSLAKSSVCSWQLSCLSRSSCSRAVVEVEALSACSLRALASSDRRVALEAAAASSASTSCRLDRRQANCPSLAATCSTAPSTSTLSCFTCSTKCSWRSR